jgi:preprotein translocase subunit YajC
MGTFLILIVPLLLLWFLVMRPAQKRQRATAELRRSLTPGQDIVTVAGMVGTVIEVDEDELVVSIAPGVEVRMLKGAVGQVRAPVSAGDDASDAQLGDDSGDASTAAAPVETTDPVTPDVAQPPAAEGSADPGPGPAGPTDEGTTPRPS